MFSATASLSASTRPWLSITVARAPAASAMPCTACFRSLAESGAAETRNANIAVFCRKIAFNLLPQRPLPGVRNRNVQRQGGCGNDQRKDKNQLEENPILHFRASNLYPAPRTVRRYCGSSASFSIFSRMRRTYTSTERGVT